MSVSDPPGPKLSDPPQADEERRPCHRCGRKTSFKTVVDDAIVYTCLACVVHPNFSPICDPAILL